MSETATANSNLITPSGCLKCGCWISGFHYPGCPVTDPFVDVEERLDKLEWRMARLEKHLKDNHSKA
jgi:hypothetical protein